MISDLDLLKRFTRDHSQDAFTDLVNRHVNLVYSAALRQVRSPHLAEEITQSVFTDLARSAGTLNQADDDAPVLTAWLYQVARRTAIDVIRKESRRQLREQIALEMNDMNATANEWTQIEPLLDDAMAALEETDRTAILLRFFENKNLREVGESLNISDDAAQKRVARAVERLREFFSKRKFTIGASGLAVLISANAVQSAPIGLAATISAAAVLTSTTVATSAVITATKTIAVTALQKALISAALVASVGAGIFEARQASQLHAQNQILQQEQAPLTAQIRQLQKDNQSLSNQIAEIGAANRLSDAKFTELLKLRGEVGVLRNELRNQSGLKTGDFADASESEEAAWLERIKILKRRMAQSPGAQIPELKYLTEHDWLLTAEHKLDTEDDVHRALGELRGNAEGNFLRTAETALRKYMDTNSGVFPTDISQLKPYFENPPDDEILQRYQIVPANSIPQANLSSGSGDWLITLKSPDSGSLWTLGSNGLGGSSSEDSDTMAILAPALKALMDAAPKINGNKSVTIQQLEPYLTTPEQKAAYQKLMQRSNPASPQ